MDNKREKPIIPALLADDVPNAKQKVIALIVSSLLFTAGFGILLYFSGKMQWHLAIKLTLIFCWLFIESITWQLWKSMSFRLTVTEKEVIVNLFFHKKKLALQDISAFEYEPIKDTNFFRFRLTGTNKVLEIATQYRDEMLTILSTRTQAVNVNELYENNKSNNDDK